MKSPIVILLFLTSTLSLSQNSDEDALTKYYRERGMPMTRNQIQQPLPSYDDNSIFDDLNSVEPLKKVEFDDSWKVNQIKKDSTMKATDLGWNQKNKIRAQSSSYAEFAESFKDNRVNTTEYVSQEEFEVTNNSISETNSPYSNPTNSTHLIYMIIMPSIIVLLLLFIFRNKLKNLLQRFGIEIIYNPK